MEEEEVVEPPAEPVEEPTTEPDYTEQLNHISEQLDTKLDHISEQLDTVNQALAAPTEPATDMNNLEQLNFIIEQLNDIYTLGFYALIVGGALFVCWLIKKAIDPLLS